jgi:hypothetical protein
MFFALEAATREKVRVRRNRAHENVVASRRRLAIAT